MPYPTIPNPASPRALRPVEMITDRAKRYRAHKNPPPAPVQCGFCASRKNIDLEHIDGNESNDAAHNKMWLCRSYNARKGSHFAKHGHGTKTRQYNPEPTGQQPSLSDYCVAVLTLRGDRPGSVPRAIRTMQNTAHRTRVRYVREIRRALNPGARTVGEYVQAIMKHRRFQHDEGGLIIHETSKAKRREFAARIWDARRKRGTADAVPF